MVGMSRRKRMRVWATVAVALMAIAMCVGMAVALGGCGSGGERTTSGDGGKQTTSPRLSVGTASNNREETECMRRDGMTGLSSAAKRRAVAKRCGFGVAKTGRSSRMPATVAAPKPVGRKRPAKNAPSFHSRVVVKVAACLHAAGIKVSSAGAALLSSTSGIRTRSPRVKAAIGKCRSEV